MPAHRDDRLALGVVRLEVGVVVARTFEEKLGRVLVAQPGHARYVFASEAQRLTAGGQHRQARRRIKQLADQRRGRQHVLEVVDHEQQLARREPASERLSRRLAFGDHHFERAGEGRLDLLGGLK